MPEVTETARALLAKARNRELPDRCELVALGLELVIDHLENEDVYTNSKGEQKTKKRPERQAANVAFQAVAGLAIPKTRGHDADDPLELRGFVQQVTSSGLAPMLMAELTKAMAEAGKGGALQ